MNAKNHGADTRCFDENSIYIMSGNRDINAYKNYSEKRTKILEKENKEIIKKHFSFFSRIKQLFVTPEKQDLGYNENTPEHLKELFFFSKLRSNSLQQNINLF